MGACAQKICRCTEAATPRQNRQSRPSIAFIQKLYRIEQHIKDQPPDERHRIRQQQAKPIIDKKFGEDSLSRTFMGLAEKLKRIQIEDVDKPVMQKIALEIDKDHLAILKKMSAEKSTTVGNLIRVSIRNFIEKDH